MKKTDMSIEKQIDAIMAKMTLHEKVEMCHANSRMTSAGVPSQDIDELTMNDGPHGVREENLRHSWITRGRTDDFCTYLPTGSALATTWNRDMAYLHGSVLGEEARFRNKDVILGPGINIVRTPICGRNFEYMSEDPCHISGLVVNSVKGIQDADTAACVKHFALNNQELDCSGVNVEVSDRALREIYLPAFKAAADAVIYCGGLNHTYDTESTDKPHIDLIGDQNELIPLLAKENPNTIVTITAGSPVTMPWLDKVRAVVWSWYSGMEGGNALADVLCGDVCPSGKMPFTLPYRLEDCPGHRYGEYQATNCRYNEDIYVGYRGYEKVSLAARETKRVTINVRKDDLRVWNDGWTLLSGSYTVYVAAASDDVRLTADILI